MFDDLNKQGVTLVVVTHDHTVATRAQRVIEMRDGKILRDGAPT
jgi:predicted ABC-type transport system involved in lysophospholipase L1 biosynthesis ATPase subunit